MIKTNPNRAAEVVAKKWEEGSSGVCEDIRKDCDLTYLDAS